MEIISRFWRLSEVCQINPIPSDPDHKTVNWFHSNLWCTLHKVRNVPTIDYIWNEWTALEIQQNPVSMSKSCQFKSIQTLFRLADSKRILNIAIMKIVSNTLILIACNKSWKSNHDKESLNTDLQNEMR